MHTMLRLKSSLEHQGWIGKNATMHGSPDCVLLHSGGPPSHLATFSLLVGPPRLRATIRQPHWPSDKDVVDDVHEIPLHQRPQQFDVIVEEWKHGAWYHKARIQASSLAHTMNELQRYSPKTSFEGEGHQKIPQHPFWVGSLSYDLVQWTQPLEFAFRPKKNSLLACFYLIEHGVVFDCLLDTLHSFKVPDSNWSPELSNWSEQKFDKEPIHNPHLSLNKQLTDDEYIDRIRSVQDRIIEGDVYQVNIGQLWQGTLNFDPWTSFCLLDQVNPAPYSAFFEIDDEGLTLISSSPECLMESIDGIVHSAPIKGTANTGVSEDETHSARQQLIHDEKERAEHRMLVDLMRNDLSHISEVSSVRVDRFDVEQYASVQHLVSRISGKLQQHLNSNDALESVFPGGSITGCPRTAVCHTINQIEQQARSFWTGSIGWFDPWSNNSSWNILIRTIEAEYVGQSWVGKIAAGGGITISSEAESEVEEAFRKARPLLEVAGWVVPTSKKQQHELNIVSLPKEHNSMAVVPNIGKVEFGQSDECDVIFIDNLDSFSLNTVHSIASKGFDVCVISARLPPYSTMHEQEIESFFKEHSARFIVIGPGPGRPTDVQFSDCLARIALKGLLRQSILGLCLGHQALGVHGGLELIKSPFGPVHGKPCQIHHEEDGLFESYHSPTKFVRYNSLVLEEQAQHQFKIIARDEEGQIMAMRHQSLPLFSVQFHPESIGSQNGDLIFSNFLNQQRIVEE